MSNTILSSLTDAVIERLKSSLDFTTPPAIDVFAVDSESLEERISQSITRRIGGDSASGICVVVGIFGLTPFGEDQRGLSAEIGVTIIENLSLHDDVSGSRRTGNDLRATVAALLMFDETGEERWIPNDTWSALSFNGSQVEERGASFIQYSMTFEATTFISATPKQEPTPSL